MLHRYETRGALAEALATGVAAVLAGGIATRGSATLVVSGGSTPKLFLETLAKAEIDWASVTVLLVDERWVPATSERSNTGFLRRHFLQGPAALARFEPLHEDVPAPEEVLPEIEARFSRLPRPFDAVILGMGEDGHTASFFPGGDRLAEAIDPACHATVLPMRAPGAGEPRITLTLPAIADARFLALHIEGAAKLKVLETAQAPGPATDYPVRAVLTAPRETPLQIFWAPLPSDEA
ncbi:6-phosphogluconolactonase [Aureimonas endophytica]|uniref:6-phosphogluconolactonase n=1 Tax=Aureimonas endophytica TaxID=2027858 RepID=A0A916ZHB4_9HYPH|nr:6-phosphogluconolactonase [Aureimonas endophytica]GGD96964.1 6-phosphogluconolactonase [Aureimonas endophytica]